MTQRKDWVIDLASAIRNCNPNEVYDKDAIRKMNIPRKAHSWYDVFKLMKAGFIQITETEDGLIELFDWADASDKPFRIVAPKDALITMIYENRFPERVGTEDI